MLAGLGCAATPAAASGAPPVGAFADLAAQPLPVAAQEIRRLAQEGVTTLRHPLDWNRVEPVSGRFSWKADDAVVNAAAAAGLEVVAVLGPCATWAVDPAWQVAAGDRASSIPKSLNAWERYVREAVRRYRGRVRYWQVREWPGGRNFRGAASEYRRLVASAARVIRAVDPSAHLLHPEAGSLDLGGLSRLCASEELRPGDAVGLYLPAAPEATPLPWSVIRHEILAERGGPPPAVFVLGAEGTLSADLWLQHYLLAWAFGAARVYLPPQTISRAWTAPLASLTYLGHLRLGPQVWALAFEEDGQPVAAVWAASEIEMPAGELAPVRDAAALATSAQLGGAPGAVVVGSGEQARLALGPRPALIRGLALEAGLRTGSPTRAEVLAARGGPDMSALPLVYADFAMPERPEFGLAHRRLRGHPGGKAADDSVGGRPCVRTMAQKGGTSQDPGNPWLYFDVDESWLYFARGRTPVAVTVECYGSYLGERQLGFNIYYDSASGYRFTPWQWVAPGYSWQRYRVELPDASFADGGGYDFRINVVGSKQDLWVASVTVEKLTLPGQAEGHAPFS